MAPPALAPGVALSEHLSYGQRTKQPFFYRSSERGPTPALGKSSPGQEPGRGLRAEFMGHPGIWSAGIVVPTTPGRGQKAEPVRAKLFVVGPLYPALRAAWSFGSDVRGVC